MTSLVMLSWCNNTSCICTPPLTISSFVVCLFLFFQALLSSHACSPLRSPSMHNKAFGMISSIYILNYVPYWSFRLTIMYLVTFRNFVIFIHLNRIKSKNRTMNADAILDRCNRNSKLLHYKLIEKRKLLFGVKSFLIDRSHNFVS